MLIGHIDSICISQNMYRILGWILDKEQDAVPSEVFLAEGDRTIARVTDFFQRSDLAAVVSASSCAFCVEVDCKHIINVHNITLYARGSSDSIGVDANAVVKQTCHAASIEEINETSIQGWVVVEEGEQADLYVDDQFATTILPHVTRLDIIQSRIAKNAQVGFHLSWRDIFFARKTSDFEIYRSNTPHVMKLCVGEQVLAQREYTVGKITIGNADGVVNGHVTGWVLCLSPESTTTTIDLHINTIYFDTIEPSVERPDLFPFGLLPNLAGIHYELPPVIIKQHINNIKLFTPDTSQLVSEWLAPDEEQAVQPTFRHMFWNIPADAFNRVTIIIPVHNAFNVFRQCMESVLKHTSPRVNILVMDDGSTDGELHEYYARFASNPRLTIHRNETNIGYVRTVNKALRLARDHDVILLNSDTIVSSGWVERLFIAAKLENRIGTVTPLSNNAGAFSAPEFGCDNSLPEHVAIEDFARAVAQTSCKLYPVVPTGNGFCLYINRAFLDDVGDFDETHFPYAYGEENDLCMRGLARGWKHLVDDSSYILHQRSSSYGEQANELKEKAQQVLDALHPQYRYLIRSFQADVSLKIARHKVRQLSRTNVKPRPRVLLILSSVSGGVPNTTRDLAREIQDVYEPFLLVGLKHRCKLYAFSDDAFTELVDFPYLAPLNEFVMESSELNNLLYSILVNYSIEIVHIRHFARLGFFMPKVCKSINLPVFFSVHDFYSLCPSVNMLTGNDRVCDGECSDGDACHRQLENSPTGFLTSSYVQYWRDKVQAFIQQVDALFFTSRHSVELFSKHLDTSNVQTLLIPHGRRFKSFANHIDLPCSRSKVRILLAGNIGRDKGERLLFNLIDQDKYNIFEFHVIGSSKQTFTKKNIVHHGPYSRESFQELVSSIKPHFGMILSQFHETYSHVLTECWSCALPVIATRCGAVPERIDAVDGGWHLDFADIKEAYRHILRIIASPDDYFAKVANILKHQLEMGREHSAVLMGHRYKQAYRNALAYDDEQGKPLYLVAVLMDFIGGQVPPTAYIRILQRCRNSLERPISFTFLAPSEFLGLKDHGCDLVLAHRDVIRAHQVASFIQKCEEEHIPYIYDIDDDLFNVAQENELSDRIATYIPSIRLLIEHARTVSVSTPNLAQKLAPLASNIHIVENALDAKVWLHQQRKNTPETYPPIQGLGDINILYMGNLTHSNDLRSIDDALTTFLNNNPRVRLFLIGVTELPTPKYRQIPIPDQAFYYPEFCKWLQCIASAFDFAICPLENTELNKSKSFLKFLEYSALRLPGVYARSEAYTEIVTKSEGGLLAGDTKEEWLSALEIMAKDAQRRATLASNAHSYVMKHHINIDHIASYDAMLVNTIRS